MKQLYTKIPALVLTLIVGLMATSTAFGTATIVIENGDAAGVGFNDPTPVSAVGGNSGTMLGQQRLNAFQFAANIWGATLTSGPTITIRASWSSTLTCTATSGTLGSAGNSGSIWRDFPGAAVPGTWYGNALANALRNTDLNGPTAEINAQFNSNIGTTGCLENSHWYYGLNTTSAPGRINLVTVLLHEFGHGLGFQTFTNSSTGVQAGSDAAGRFPSIYDRFLFDNSTGKTWPQMNDAERVTSAINTFNVAWNGPQVTSDAATVLTSGKDSAGRPVVYTPNPREAGSSVSHWDKTANPNQLMEPNISSSLSHSVSPPQDLTFSLMRDIGWCSGCPQPPPPSPTPIPSPPANDNFANAQVISGCSGSVNGTNTGATKEPGEQSHSPDNDPGGGSIWYRWQAPSSGSGTITTANSAHEDTVLAVYTGDSVNALSAITKNDDVQNGVIRTSSVNFPATAGTVYKIAVDGWNNIRGDIVLNWTMTCKTDQTINFPALPDKTFGDPPFNISATATSGLPVSFTIVSPQPQPITISGTTVNINGTGAVTVQASQQGNTNFNQAPSVERTFTVARANQTITFNALANKAAGDAPFSVSATSSSGLPVSFTIASGPATISLNTVSITGAGVVTVRASQGGDNNYNPAPLVDRNFTVAAGTYESVVLTVDQNEIKTWTFQGRTYAYVKLLFPNAGYRVPNWGQAIRTSNDFTADAAVERFTGASVQAVTTTAQIYDLGALSPGSYNFIFKTTNTAVRTLPFTVVAPPFPPNSIDAAREFVKQQYRDFLNREADQAGEDFWTDNITKCSDPARRPPGQTEAQCTLRQRETTSGAFFLSPEFQYTGYYVLRMYQGALGRQPKLSEFLPDAQFVGSGIIINGQLSGAKINQNKADFAAQFVNCTDPAKYRCAEFKAIYDGLSNTQYVDKLFERTGATPSVDERNALVNGLNGLTLTRAAVLQKVVDGIDVISEGNQQFTTTYGQAFYNSEFNRAFVQLEYFGYMKRDPDDGGNAFWLGKLNQFGGNFVNAEMVLAFISSPEYRARFGQP